MELRFGKFKGQQLSNTPQWYQNWLTKQDWFFNPEKPSDDLNGLKNRIEEIAKIYNSGNIKFLTEMTMKEKRIVSRYKSGKLTDDDIHEMVYYYEEEYHGDMWEEACFGKFEDNY